MPLETSYDRDQRMINMMTMRDTMISFSSIKDMLTADRKAMFKVLVLFKRTLYKQVIKNDYNLHHNLDQTAGVY
jgi:hypothetical protein